MYRSIYKQQNGTIAVTFPADEKVSFEGMVGIAKLVTPPNVPFKVITHDDLPSSYELQEAWEMDDTEFTDGVGMTLEEKKAYFEAKKGAQNATNG
jgi:hypothetical protein